MTKVVIIGGTHQRETEYSNPTIDLILEQFGIDEQPEEYIGLDGARKSQLWNINENLSVAKVIRTGPISKNYIESITTIERHFYMIQLLQYWSTFSGFEPAEDYRGVIQRTSVHGQIFKDSHADFNIDLHSYHKYGRGKPGTAMEIISNPFSSFTPIIGKALLNAKISVPLIYGVERPNPYHDKSLDLNHIPADIISDIWGNSWDYRELGQKHDMITHVGCVVLANAALAMHTLDGKIAPERQIDILTTDPRSIDPEIIEDYRHRIFSGFKDRNFTKNQLSSLYMKDPEFKMLIDNESSMYLMPDCFVFEAITWQKEQQQATAMFIKDYLIPELKSQ